MSAAPISVAEQRDGHAGLGYAPDVSAAVVAWNGRELVERCLRALLASRGVDLDVTVVDNASAERPDALRPAFPGVRFVRSEENLGFARANNLALRQARGRALMLLNPDCFVEPDTVAALLRALDERPRAGAVGPLLTYADGSLQYSAFRDVTPATLLWEYFLLDLRFPNHRMAGRYEARDYRRARRVDGLLGACLLVRRDAAEHVGLLDERFFMYCEEVDWCRRLRAAGWELWHEPAARAVHLAGASTSTVYGDMVVELHRSRFQLYAKHERPRVAWLMRSITKAGLCYQLLWAWKEHLRGRLPGRLLAQRVRTFRRVLSLPARPDAHGRGARP